MSHPGERLAAVRRYEAAGFRAWPATTVSYDGTWVIRLSAGHPAKRLNSVNPLDPGDVADIAGRVARAAARFEASGRPLTFRVSPLSGPQLSAYFDAEGWSRFGESLVMRLPLSGVDLEQAADLVPFEDIGLFVSAALQVQGADPSLRAALCEVIGAIQPRTGLFAMERGDAPLATMICVHDSDLAGLFEVATQAAARRQGHGRKLLLAVLKWAQRRGAREAWLQVEAANAPALALYCSLGFAEVYRYHYRRPPGA